MHVSVPFVRDASSSGQAADTYADDDQCRLLQLLHGALGAARQFRTLLSERVCNAEHERLASIQGRALQYVAMLRDCLGDAGGASDAAVSTLLNVLAERDRPVASSAMSTAQPELSSSAAESVADEVASGTVPPSAVMSGLQSLPNAADQSIRSAVSKQRRRAVLTRKRICARGCCEEQHVQQSVQLRHVRQPGRRLGAQQQQLDGDVLTSEQTAEQRFIDSPAAHAAHPAVLCPAVCAAETPATAVVHDKSVCQWSSDVPAVSHERVGASDVHALPAGEPMSRASAAAQCHPGGAVHGSLAVDESAVQRKAKRRRECECDVDEQAECSSKCKRARTSTRKNAGRKNK